MQRWLGEQARRIEELTEQLAQAAMFTGEPTLTLDEAQAQHLLDWQHIHAAFPFAATIYAVNSFNLENQPPLFFVTPR